MKNALQRLGHRALGQTARVKPRSLSRFESNDGISQGGFTEGSPEAPPRALPLRLPVIPRDQAQASPPLPATSDSPPAPAVQPQNGAPIAPTEHKESPPQSSLPAKPSETSANQMVRNFEPPVKKGRPRLIIENEAAESPTTSLEKEPATSDFKVNPADVGNQTEDVADTASEAVAEASLQIRKELDDGLTRIERKFEKRSTANPVRETVDKQQVVQRTFNSPPPIQKPRSQMNAPLPPPAPAAPLQVNIGSIVVRAHLPQPKKPWPNTSKTQTTDSLQSYLDRRTSGKF